MKKPNKKRKIKMPIPRGVFAILIGMLAGLCTLAIIPNNIYTAILTIIIGVFLSFVFEGVACYFISGYPIGYEELIVDTKKG